jgi:hypothetical protein
MSPTLARISPKCPFFPPSRRDSPPPAPPILHPLHLAIRPALPRAFRPGEPAWLQNPAPGLSDSRPGPETPTTGRPRGLPHTRGLAQSRTHGRWPGALEGREASWSAAVPCRFSPPARRKGAEQSGRAPSHLLTFAPSHLLTSHLSPCHLAAGEPNWLYQQRCVAHDDDQGLRFPQPAVRYFVHARRVRSVLWEAPAGRNVCSTRASSSLVFLFFGGVAPSPHRRSAGIPARPCGDRPRRAAEKLGNESWGRCLLPPCRSYGAWVGIGLRLLQTGRS